ncbi:metallophosphoesterase family protein [Deinococcus planocerae]|uniref:metallophosphoesterase family protein n=1 Tax=Deinococcus planocerae TaxID=1737569 RepID=UPI000C7EF355|nr:metallophosphoesterase family protein [Deinococcus planocerae]
MPLAALYDVHGNLPALEAVLDEVERVGARQVLIGGDVAYGPFVRETLDLLLALGDRAGWVRGNADRELVEFFDTGTTGASLPDDQRRALAWEAQRLDRSHRDFLAALPHRRRVEVEGLGPVLFCHGSPRSDEEIITRLTSEERLARLLAGVEERVVVCGHTHVPFDRVVGGVRVVNAGSVGMGYGPPGASWALLGPGVEVRHTGYDRERAAALFRRSGHPLGDTFAENVERPASAEEASTFFEELALRRERADVL